jgi:hypothetical protein
LSALIALCAKEFHVSVRNTFFFSKKLDNYTEAAGFVYHYNNYSRKKIFVALCRHLTCADSKFVNALDAAIART